MRLIHLGQGRNTEMWSAAAARHPQVTPVAAVATGDKGLGLPTFEGLDSALQQVIRLGSARLMPSVRAWP